jgi:hypothetical protein
MIGQKRKSDARLLLTDLPHRPLFNPPFLKLMKIFLGGKKEILN